MLQENSPRFLPRQPFGMSSRRLFGKQVFGNVCGADLKCDARIAQQLLTSRGCRRENKP